MNYNFLNRCSGISIPVPKFTQAAQEVFESIVNKVRVEASGIFPILSDGLYLGHRFYSNDTVLQRITSAGTEEEFLSDPECWVMDALRACASADHWYTFEKEW